MANPLFGVTLHGVGALSSSLCYTPQKKVRDWSWQTYWLAQASVCWLLLPISGAVLSTPHLLAVLHAAPPSSMLRATLLGFFYGVGGTAFGVALRYLGFSITYSISVGLSCVLGTLLPPILAGEVHRIAQQAGSAWIFAGVALAATGIAASGVAGWLRDRRPSHVGAAARPHSDLGKGLLFAIAAGLLSAVFGLALSAGQPIADTAARFGAGQYQGNIILVFACGGAFLSTLIICLVLHYREDSIHEYMAFADGPARRILAANLVLAMLTGALWYGQFLCYGIAHTYMGFYKFTSWSLHMSMLVLFSTGLGLALREWDRSGKQAIVSLLSAIVLLLTAVGFITYGSYIGGQ
jgi:L-rhamnose-H+ transport protein